MARQFRKLVVQEAKVTSTGQSGVAVYIKDADAYVVITDPQQIASLAKTLDKFAGVFARNKLSVPERVLRQTDAIYSDKRPTRNFLGEYN